MESSPRRTKPGSSLPQALQNGTPFSKVIQELTRSSEFLTCHQLAHVGTSTKRRNQNLPEQELSTHRHPDDAQSKFRFIGFEVLVSGSQ